MSPVGGGKGDGVSPVQMVVVPRVSRDSHYYRHSRKRRRGMLIKAAPDEEPEEEVCASPMCLLIRIDSLSLSLAHGGTMSSHVLGPYRAPSVSGRTERITVV